MMTLDERGVVRPPFDLASEMDAHHDITDKKFWATVQLVQAYSELPVSALFNLYQAANYIVEANVPGDIVECGVHMGGSVMLVEHVLMNAQQRRNVFALDTFKGFVRRSPEWDVDLKTGEAAGELEDVPADYTVPSTDNMRSVEFEGLHIVKGDVLDTIPDLPVEQIALLRLDTDTYDTTKFELEQLYDRVALGGVVIADDYGYTVGCKKAVDDFILDKKVLLQRINPNVRCWVKLTD